MSAFANGLRSGGVFRPGVLWVAAFELFADFRIRIGPEAGEVIRDLLRAKVGRQQMQEHGDTTAGDAGCLQQSKDFLNADGEDRRPIL